MTRVPSNPETVKLIQRVRHHGDIKTARLRATQIVSTGSIIRVRIQDVWLLAVAQEDNPMPIAFRPPVHGYDGQFMNRSPSSELVSSTLYAKHRKRTGEIAMSRVQMPPRCTIDSAFKEPLHALVRAPGHHRYASDTAARFVFLSDASEARWH